MATDAQIERAKHIIATCLPKFATRDEALDNLYYVEYGKDKDVKLYSIAAALYILSEADNA